MRNPNAGLPSGRRPSIPFVVPWNFVAPVGVQWPRGSLLAVPNHFLKENDVTKMLLMIPAMLITSGLLAADGKPAAPAEKAAPSEKKPWTIEATPKVTTVQPGGKLDFTVRVINSANANASFFIRTQAWFAKSDNPNIVFPGLSVPPGMNPEISLNKLALTAVTLAPKEAYTHDWSSTVAKDCARGRH